MSETIFLKKFNNFIKTLLIEQFRHFVTKHITYKNEFSVLDLCCGRGGDLFKWAYSGAAHYVGVDLSFPLVTEAKRRYT